MFRYPVVVLLSASLCLAVTAVQTDWSRGPNQPGPVSEFGSAFSEGVNIDWESAHGEVVFAGELMRIPVGESVEGAISLFPADIDGDGDVDLASAALEGDEIAWWENADGTGFAWTRHEVSTSFSGASDVVAADIDGDGDIDLLGAGKTLYGGNDFVWWENMDGSGGSFTPHLINGDSPGAHAVCAADVDGDGDMDVLGASIYLDTIAWWENQDGTGTDWSTHLIDIEFDGAWTIHTSDIDGDGDIDVVGGAYYGDEVAWFENYDGVGLQWEQHTISENANGIYRVHTFDMDGDGDADILGAITLADQVVWWENLEGNWPLHIIDGAYDSPTSVHGVDMDGDGDGDVLATSVLGDLVTIWMNTEVGVWDRSDLDSAFDGAIAVTAADLDGDGDPDAAGAAQLADEVVWWNSSPSGGALESSILYTGSDPIWGTLDWTSRTPEGATVTFQVRASDDPGDLGEWSEVLTVPSLLSDLLAEGDSYVQYRSILQTEDPSAIPILEQVEISWISTAVEESASPVNSGIVLLPFQPNPAGAFPVIRFHLGLESSVQLTVFDLTGRVVWTRESATLATGYHEIMAGRLSTGVYLCRMVSDSFSSTGRFLVTE